MWAIKQLHFDLKKAGDLRKLQIFEQEETRNDAHARISKHRTKFFHGKFINRKNFVSGQKVLLYNSRLHLFPGKLKTRWSGPYVVQTIFPHGAIEVSDPKSGNTFKVNGQRLKPFFITESEHNVFELGFCDLVYM